MKMGNRIRHLRNDQRPSLEKLAGRSRISRSMPSEIERDAQIDAREFALGPGDAVRVEAKQNHDMRAAGEDGFTCRMTAKGPRPEFVRYRP